MRHDGCRAACIVTQASAFRCVQLLPCDPARASFAACFCCSVFTGEACCQGALWLLGWEFSGTRNAAAHAAAQQQHDLRFSLSLVLLLTYLLEGCK